MGFEINCKVGEKYYNAKRKIYPDGSFTTVYCLCPIFRDSTLDNICFLDSEIDDFYEVVDLSEYKEVVTDSEKENHKKIKCRDVSHLSPDYIVKQQIVDKEHHIKRAKDKIFDICMMNDWKWFFTGTFALSDLRVSPADCLKKMRSWLNNQVNRKGLKYILVAEYSPKHHYIHFHGLFNDCDLHFTFDDMYKVDGHKKPVKLSTLKRMRISPDTCKKVYNVSEWDKSFGWCTAIKCYGDKIHLSRYITKYLTKENEKIFGKYYWSSKNIRRDPDIVYFDVDESFFWEQLPEELFYIPYSSDHMPLKYDCSFRRC